MFKKTFLHWQRYALLRAPSTVNVFKNFFLECFLYLWVVELAAFSALRPLGQLHQLRSLRREARVALDENHADFTQYFSNCL